VRWRPGDRNVVERFFIRIKQWRSRATRYDKLAVAYRAGAVPHALFAGSHYLGAAA